MSRLTDAFIEGMERAMGTTQRITQKYRITVEEFQTWSVYHDAQSEDKQEWTETDQIVTAKKASLAAYLRGLADELDPVETKTIYRDR